MNVALTDPEIRGLPEQGEHTLSEPAPKRTRGPATPCDGRYDVGAVKRVIDTESHIAAPTQQRGAIGNGERV